MTRLNAVVVGAGLMGRWHADAARRAGASVTGVVDRDAGRARKLAHRVGGVPAFDDIGQALAAGKVDVVHVCTPLDSHLAVAVQAVGAGCHVLVEKPMVADTESADELFAAAAARGVVVCPVHQFLFQPGALQAVALLPAMGKLRHVEMEVASTGADPSAADRDDVALEILPHGLAFAARLCGTGIAAVDWDVVRVSAGEMAISAVVDETRLAIRISMRGRPPANRLRLVTDGGTIELDLFSGFAIVDRTSATRVMKIARPFYSAATLGVAASRNLLARAVRIETAYPGLRELVRRFYAAARGTEASPIPPAESRAVTELWSRLRHAIRPGRSALLSADFTHSR